MKIPKKIQKLTIDYLEGKLKGHDRLVFEHFMKKHPEFVNQIADYQDIGKKSQINEPEPRPEAFWQAYHQTLKEKIHQQEYNIFNWPKLAKNLSMAALIIIFTSIITLSVYEPHVLALDAVPRETIVEELISSDSIIDTYVLDNIQSEDIINTFLPEITENDIYAVEGGDIYEVL